MNTIKKLLLLSAALVSSGLCLAQEIAQVISSTPILQQVGVPRQVCSTESTPDGQPKAGTGATGSGRFVSNATAQGQSAKNCNMQTFYENRPVAYNVVYEVGGRQYSVQLPNDPGPTLLLQVGPASTIAPIAPPPGAVTYAQPVYQQPVYVVDAPVVYPGYYEPNYFLPFALGLGFGWWGGFHGHGHWH